MLELRIRNTEPAGKRMPKFLARRTEHLSYSLEIEAANADAAVEMAMDAPLNRWIIDAVHPGSVHIDDEEGAELCERAIVTAN